jgi:hypothetical protein
MGTQDEWFEATGTNIDHAFGATGTGFVGFDNSFSDPPAYDTGGYLTGTQYGAFGQAFLNNDTDWPPADTYSANASVFGPSTEFTGVAGISSWAPCVYGHHSLIGQDQSSIPNGLDAGVLGTSTNWAGVIGWSSDWHGVYAHTINGEAAVLGVAENGVGVWAISGGNGPQVPKTSNVASVFATSDQQHGVIGTTNANVGASAFPPTTSAS